MSVRNTVQVRTRLAAIAVLVNLIVPVIFTGFLLFLAPGQFSAGEVAKLQSREIWVMAVFVVAASVIGGWLVGWRPFTPIARWLTEGRPPTGAEREQVLGYPRQWALRTLVAWAFGMVVAGAVGATVSPVAVLATVLAVPAAAVACGGMAYVMVERVMRPITALALADVEPPESRSPGVGLRLTALWALGCGFPLLAIAVLGVLDLSGVGSGRERVVVAAVFLAVAGLLVGFAATRYAARSIADPLTALRVAQQRLRAGDLTARVEVDDGSEIGLLQAGFNHMADGLAERERLRAAFGAFVDPGLTERVLREGIDLAGADVEVSLLFTDVRGFTAFAETADARDVVAALNELYGTIVPIVLRHGGHANKFIGDGLLAVFGVPDRLDDHAQRSVAAGLEIVDAVHVGAAGLRVGVGINSGKVVAGTIGGGGRVDFTVIGDAVNTAARIEAATRQTGDDLLITHSTWTQLHDDHAWVEREPVPLKGKSQLVRIYAPSIKPGIQIPTPR
ncbi:adenylate/guanylate cyclase domain-containing protein [Nocardia sp. NPDC051570]|uniref:adenylate/guanylate cyclase domain-containing protein n=1 Tax=Nocardia sp. NPDC051570 TaxID=3364324 RepID=UPI0037A11FE6